MSQRPAAPKTVIEGHAKSALSGDVKVDEGERVYVAEGDLIAGKYSVERVLGVGGVGFVVATRHVDLGGHFALKFLKKRFLSDKAIVERFTREAKAACRIKSDYVARVYDVGTHGRAPFIVMEHLVGRDLSAVLAERGAFAVSEAVEYTVQACAALAVAHASGIVHRDIKPENLFLVDEEGLPTIKLLDFGISKIALASDRPTDEWGTEGEPITGTAICGTPFYMSPEQIRSTATVDARSDVWSLGMVLYEMLAAATAFQAETVMDVCSAILDQEARWLTDLRPEVPPGLSDVVARCLQKNPANRFTNVAELAVAILPFAPARALAIAEGSAYIRRAAIHTLGSSTSAGGHPANDGRVSGSFGTPVVTATPVAPVSPSSPGSSGSSALARSSPTLTRGDSRSLRPAPLPPPRRRVAFIAGAALVAGTMAAFGVARMLRGHEGDAVKPPPTATTPTPTPTVTEPVPAAAAPSAAPSAVADDRSAPSAWHPLPVASPASAAVPAAPAAHPYVAPPRAHPAPVRTQPSAKAVVSSSPASTESTSPPPAIAPPLTPGRPDLGY
jgi:eukaryotic-like serine/threonine-protein kinase